MGDPGLAFLYDQRPSRQGQRHHQQQSEKHERPEPTLAMQHLPREPAHASSSSVDWGACVGNVENAKLAVSALQGLIADAVFLDEEAYTNAATLQLYQQRLQVVCDFYFFLLVGC